MKTFFYAFLALSWSLENPAFAVEKEKRHPQSVQVLQCRDGSLCASPPLPAGAWVTLFSDYAGVPMCFAQATKDTFMEDFGYTTPNVTKLKASKSCSDKHRVGLVGKIELPFEHFPWSNEMENVPDAEIQSLKKIIKSTEMIPKALKNCNGVSLEYVYKNGPSVYRLTVPGKTAYYMGYPYVGFVVLNQVPNIIGDVSCGTSGSVISSFRLGPDIFLTGQLSSEGDSDPQKVLFKVKGNGIELIPEYER